MSTVLAQPRTVRQIDIVPTLSLLLQVPIPFSNVGKVIPEVAIMGIREPHSSGRSALAWMMHANVVQVMRFLAVYSAENYDELASMHAAAEGRYVACMALHTAAHHREDMTGMHCDATTTSSSSSSSEDCACCAPVIALFDALLVDVQAWAEREWTAFDEPMMVHPKRHLGPDPAPTLFITRHKHKR